MRSILVMDPGALGGIIGIGVMACGMVSYSCYDKRKLFLKKWNQFRFHKQDNQSLLPVLVVNPRLVRLDSKHFQMKQLLGKK